ncbi:MAG TPA: hypothetical protein VK843_16485, partial [Planctomycetota bacterium]|nr:hypothetical protein [Planctomycetota bacterium]
MVAAADFGIHGGEVMAMIRWTKWLAVLLLALSTQACASLTLEEWANDRAPRSEVIGFIDGHGRGDALIVRLSGEPDCQDGVYAITIVERVKRQAELVTPAPMLLDVSEVTALQAISSGSPRVARLDCSQTRHSPQLLAVDGYERVDGALRKIEIADRLYFVDVESQIDVAESSFTRVAAQAGHGSNGDLEVRGVAYLPPARRVPGRFLPAIVAAPFALAFDIVTFPVQTVAAFF